MSRWSDARSTDAHRPYPAPDGPWAGHMSWTDLLFMHWKADAGELAARLPEGVALDRIEGDAWITVTAHRLARMGPRLGPWLPPFAELNVRTYVSADGKPGVVFLSLHAPNPLVVAGGRALGVPYRLGRTVLRRKGATRRFASRAGNESLSAAYTPQQGKLDDVDRLLAERYAMYSHARTWLRTDVQHPPWPLQPVEAQVSHSLDAYGIQGPPERMAYSSGVDVVLWAPERVRSHPVATTELSVPISH